MGRGSIEDADDMAELEQGASQMRADEAGPPEDQDIQVALSGKGLVRPESAAVT